MKRLEEELRNALRRKEAPPGFVDRLSGRISTHPLQKRNQWRKWVSLFQLPKMAWAVVGVVICLAAVVGVAQYRSYQKTRAEGELAKTQLMLALKIAGKKLNFAQRKVLEIHNRGVPSERHGDQ
jgi:hypothetical protein